MERSRRAQLTTKQKAVRADKERNRRSNTVDQKRMEQKITHSQQERNRLQNMNPEVRAQHNPTRSRQRQNNRQRSNHAQRSSNGITKVNIDDFQEKDVKELDFGPMDQVCEFCGAKFWNAERNSDGTYSKCCNNGKIKLPPVRPPPPYVKELLLGISPSAKIFKNKARAFNTKSSFASVTMKQSLFPSTRGVPAMRISGSVYHNIGAIHPEANVQAKFMQTFFYESEQLPNDFEFNVPERQIHSCILQEIRNFNSFLRSVQQALDAHAGIPLFRLIISDKPPPNTATRTYNQPTSVEISAIIVG